MQFIVIFFLLINLLFIIVIFTKVTIFIHFSHWQDDDFIKIQLKAWNGILSYTYEVPFIKLKTDEPGIVYEKDTLDKKKKESKSKVTPEEVLNRISEMKTLIKNIGEFFIIMKKLLKSIQVVKFEWHTVIGVNNAAYTGMLTGFIWSLKGMLIGGIGKYMRLMEKPTISLSPSFQQAMSQTSFQCMFRLRIGNAILAGLKILKHWRRDKSYKELFQMFKSSKGKISAKN